MKPTIQLGVHPDAESLNAFVEQASPAAERQEILAHLALCGRCREVVFLAQQAASAEADARAVVVSSEPSRSWRRWFAGWRWTWVPATALAGLVGFAVLHHFRSTPSETEVARNTPREALSNASATTEPESTKAEPASRPAITGSALANEAIAKKAGSPTLANRKDLGVVARKTPESRNLPVTVRDKDQPVQEMSAVTTEPSVAAKMQSVHGKVASAQKSGNIGGPNTTNNAFQQQLAGQQQEIAQDQLHSARYTAKAGGVGGAAPGSAGRADAQGQPAPMAPSPTAARELAMQTEAKSSGATDRVALDSKKKVTVLPNGTNALSVATAQGRTVAIDSAGAMYLSETVGGQWMPVATQWTGRAVLVRARPTATQAGISPQPAIFELVTDKIETWVSPDGKTWHAELISPQ